jgi:hypothetical protein
VIFADDRHDHADCKLCDSLGGVGGYSRDLDTKLGCGFEVNVVEACTAEYDVFLEDFR